MDWRSRDAGCAQVHGHAFGAAMFGDVDAVGSHATFESTAELLMVTMSDCWRRLVLARDRQPYQALGHSQLEFSPSGSQYSGMIQSK